MGQQLGGSVIPSDIRDKGGNVMPIDGGAVDYIRFYKGAMPASAMVEVADRTLQGGHGAFQLVKVQARLAALLARRNPFAAIGAVYVRWQRVANQRIPTRRGRRVRLRQRLRRNIQALARPLHVPCVKPALHHHVVAELRIATHGKVAAGRHAAAHRKAALYVLVPDAHPSISTH